MTTIIGYQGDVGSYSERAATVFAGRNDVQDFELRACGNSQGVVDALLAGEVDFAVYAVENSVGGPVQETIEATAGVSLAEKDRTDLLIRHNLYGRSDVDPASIRVVLSHEQALRQCASTLAKLCPNAVTLDAPDTSLAAKFLAGDLYSDDAAVVCSEEAGAAHQLHLIERDVQDSPTNTTTFVLMALPYDAKRPAPAPADRAAAFAISPKAIEWTIKVVIVATVFGAFLLRDMLGWSTWDSALAFAGVAAAIVFFLGSRRFENWFHRRALSGYWSYKPVPMMAHVPLDQAHDIVRVVHIDEDDDGRVRLKGWQEGDGVDAPRWESTTTLTSPPGTRKGSLLYEYSNTENQGESRLKGVVYLTWDRAHPADRIDRMSGWYTGFSTGDVGKIAFERVDEATFFRVCNQGIVSNA